MVTVDHRPRRLHQLDLEVGRLTGQRGRDDVVVPGPRPLGQRRALVVRALAAPPHAEVGADLAPHHDLAGRDRGRALPARPDVVGTRGDLHRHRLGRDGPRAGLGHPRRQLEGDEDLRARDRLGEGGRHDHVAAGARPGRHRQHRGGGRGRRGGLVLLLLVLALLLRLVPGRRRGPGRGRSGRPPAGPGRASGRRCSASAAGRSRPPGPARCRSPGAGGSSRPAATAGLAAGSGWTRPHANQRAALRPAGTPGLGSRGRDERPARAAAGVVRRPRARPAVALARPRRRGR